MRKRLRRRQLAIKSYVPVLLLWGAIVIIVTMLIRVAPIVVAQWPSLQALNLAEFVSIGLLTYLAGHALRTLRLALIIADARIGLRNLAAFHLFTATVSLALPFKLGEIFRVTELSNLVANGVLRSATVVWIERVFDVAALMLVTSLALSLHPTAAVAIMPFLSASALFVILSAMLIFLVPDNLRRVAVYVMRRYSDRRSVVALRFLAAARQATSEALQLLRGRAGAVASVTLLIWLCELASFAMIVSGLNRALTGLLAFVSAIAAGGSLLGLLHEAPPRFMAYLLFTQVSLAILGLPAAIYYSNWRLKVRAQAQLSSQRAAQ